MIKKLITLVITFNFIISLLLTPLALAAVTVGEGSGATGDRAMYMHWQRKIIYDSNNDQWWAFWYNGTEWVYRYSSDRITWSGEAILSTKDAYGRSGVDCIYDHDTTDVYCVYIEDLALDVWFRRGNVTLTTIDWAAEVMAYPASHTTQGLNIIRLGNDDLVLAVTNYDGLNPDSVFLRHSEDEGATWSTNASLPISLDYAPIGGNAGAMLTNLAGNDAMLIAKNSSNHLLYSTFNGNSWSALSQVYNMTLAGGQGGYSAIYGTNDVVHVSYLDQMGYLYYVQWNGLLWGTPVLAYSTALDIDSFPAISYDTVNDDIYVAWLNDTADAGYYVFSVDDGSHWSGRTTWVDEDTLNVNNNELSLAAYEQDVLDPNICILYLTDNTTDYFTRIECLGINTTGDIDQSLEVTNLDFNQYIIAGKKYYDFRASSKVYNDGTVDTVRIRFSDGATQFTASYDNTTDTFTVDEGGSIIDLNTGISSATSYVDIENNNTLLVHFYLFPKEDILDANDVIVYMYTNTSTGLSKGFENVATIDIMNKGGSTEYAFSGSCDRVPGGDYADMYCEEGASGSWGAVNITWMKLQHYHARFSMRMSENLTGEDQYWQDSSNDGGGAEKSSDKGDWQLRVTFYFGDSDINEFVEGWSALLQMEEGDIGADDYWSGINVTWSTAGSEGANHTIYGFPTIEPDATLELWMDLWFNKINGSNVHGGRFNPAFYGMQNSGWILWSTWTPFMGNATVSNYFNETKDADGNVTNAASIEFMKVGFNLTRPTTQAGEADFRITLFDFVISEFKIAGGRMEGVNTPILVETKVPDMPSTGFLAPLYAAILSLADMIVGAITWGGQQVWLMLSDQFPWFTTSVETAYEMATDFTGLLTTVWGYIHSVLTWITDSISILILPITVIHDVWVLIHDTYISLFGTTNISEIAAVFILVITLLSLLSAVDAGDWPFIGSLVKAAWGIASTILHWSFMIIGFIIKLVTSLKFW